MNFVSTRIITADLKRLVRFYEQITGAPLAESLFWFRVLVVFDIIFTISSLALVDIVLVG